MKIIKFEAENFKRLSAVEITPTGDLVEICGGNGQGKTSILDAIFCAIAGPGAMKGQPEPIRRGADTAHIRLDMGELIIRRSFKRKGDETTQTLTVESPDGAQFKGPQGILNSLIDAISFDPLGFLRMSPAEQFNAFCKFVPGFDFAADEALHRGDFSKRTEQNRIAKDRRAAAGLISIPEGFAPISEDAIIDALSEASGDNDRLAERQRRREAVKREADDFRAEAAGARANIESRELKIKDLMTEIADWKSDEENATAQAAERDSQLASAKPLPAPVDTAALRDQLTAARAHNAAGARAAERDRLLVEAQAAEDAADALSAKMTARETAKRAAIAAAKMPIAGVEFGDGHIRLNGSPFSQASDAEQLRASIAIAMANNNKLRVIRVRDGSLLDPAGMRLLAEMADAADYQVWIERVETTGTVGIVIEDGAVKAVNAHAAE
jgi:RecA/RadA recombinase